MNRNMKESLIGGRNVPHCRGLSLNKTSKDTDENMDLFSRNRQSLSAISFDKSDHQRNKSFPFVLIDENGTLNDAGLSDFGKEVKMAEGGVPYFLISIIGPQSSGKSTLLNHAFGTNFTEMDANTTRGATTHGIWLAKSPNVSNCTLVMDLEGSDGNERGEDDTKFEKQAAIFAFAVSDIVLINMWSNSVGCVNAASIPLLRNVFEATRKLKLHDSKKTLWFVIRDKSDSPTNVIEECLWKDISRAWDTVAKGTPLSNSFEVRITILPHYVHERQQFDMEVVNLGEKLLEELTINGKTMRPSSGFSLSVQDLWQKIKESKDLDLPARRVMVAKVQCEEIADKMLSSFENKDWRNLPHDVQSGQVKDFGKSLNLIINEHLSAYDKETEYYDEGVRTKKRMELRDTMMKLVEPTCDTMLEYIHSQILNEFKEEFPKEFQGNFDKRAVSHYIKSFMAKFDQRCKDNGVNQYYRTLSKSRARLQHDIITHVIAYSSVKTNKVNRNPAGVGIGVLGAAGLAAAGITAGIKLGPAGFPIAAACATGFAQLTKHVMDMATGESNV